MVKVKVLIEGYARQIENGWIASSTVTLIQIDGKNIMVDPGCNRQRLLTELSKNDLRPQDIDFVFLTHGHTDHVLLTGFFENTKVINHSEVYEGDKQIKHQDRLTELNLRIIPTPGHSEDSCSLIIKAGDGIYAVVGDVFWWTVEEKQRMEITKPDPYAKDKNKDKLIKSRKKILKIADWIIPGHGKIFKNPLRA